MKLTLEKLKQTILEAIEDKKGFDTTIIDLKNKTFLADYFIISEGSSTTHLQTMADEIIFRLKKSKVLPLGTEGQKNSGWILIDYGDIIVHLFNEESRKYYKLEDYWNKK